MKVKICKKVLCNHYTGNESGYCDTCLLVDNNLYDKINYDGSQDTEGMINTEDVIKVLDMLVK